MHLVHMRRGRMEQGIASQIDFSANEHWTLKVIKVAEKSESKVS